MLLLERRGRITDSRVREIELFAKEERCVAACVVQQAYEVHFLRVKL